MRRQDNVARYVYWELCGKTDLQRIEKWYEQKSDRTENEGYKILQGMNMHCNEVIQARRLDIGFIIKEEREVTTTDISVPGDTRVKDKELEKQRTISG